MILTAVPAPHVPETTAAAAGFHPFGLGHALSVLWCIAVVAPLVLCCLRWRRRAANGLDPLGEEKARTATLLFAGFGVCVNVWSITYWLLPERFDLKMSLPLQLCDLACLCAPIALAGRQRWARALLYFWGIGLSTQAFITPTLTQGPETMRYWLFWWLHVVIVGSAVHDCVVWKYRPTGRDFLTATAVSLCWVGAMMLLNAHLGANYGYLGSSTPDRPTIVDLLGPWPLRVLVLGSIVTALFAVLWAAWPIADRLRLRGSSAGGPA